MRYVQRNEAGAIVGDFARAQPGIADEALEDDNAELVAFQTRVQAVLDAPAPDVVDQVLANAAQLARLKAALGLK